MSITIDFDTVDMRDVETLAMLIDDFMEPDYSKILDIIQDNGQFTEFLNYYTEINGSPFVKRQILSTTTTFCKEFDVEEGWPYLGDKEIDEDDFLPSNCVIVKDEQPNSSNVKIQIVKEYNYFDDEDSNDMETDHTAENENVVNNDGVDNVNVDAVKPPPPSGKLILDKEFNNVLNRLERDFPQKSKRIKRISRWAPVIFKKPVKVGDARIYDERQCPEQVDEGGPSQDASAESLALVPYGSMDAEPGNIKRKMQPDAETSEDEPALKLKCKKSATDKVFYEARYRNNEFIIVEDDYRTKSFHEFKYSSHYRAGRFHILSRDQISSSVSYINEISTIIVKGLYEIE